jgi:hypothetical protein
MKRLRVSTLMILLTLSCADGETGNAPRRGDSTAHPVQSADLVADTLPCERATQSRHAVELSRMKRQLTGDYLLTVIATRGGGPDTIVHGSLQLRPSSVIVSPSHSAETYPLSGSANIAIERLGRVSLAYSPGTRDSIRPGVQVSHRRSDQRISLVFGNAASPLGGRTDSGVYFDVLDVSDRALLGVWRDGGRKSPLPQGYFCARRL